MRSYFAFLVFCVVSGMSCCGCGSGQVPVYPVKGKITESKESLEGTQVVFTPVDTNGLLSVGLIEKDGSYALRATDGRDGAAAGKYKVSFTLGPEAMKTAMANIAKNPPKTSAFGPGNMKPGGSKGGSSPPTFKYPFPDAYSSPKTSPKEVEVKTGQNVIDISF